jgi:hypothetical protein
MTGAGSRSGRTGSWGWEGCGWGGCARRVIDGSGARCRGQRQNRAPRGCVDAYTTYIIVVEIILFFMILTIFKRCNTIIMCIIIIQMPEIRSLVPGSTGQRAH